MITYGGNAELSYGAFVFLVGFLITVLVGFIVWRIWDRAPRKETPVQGQE